MMSLGTIIISDLVPLRKRGVYQGLGSICYSIGAALGGPIGGVMADSIGWRWAFLLQVPLAIVSAAISSFYIRIPTHSKDSRLSRVDFAGAFTLVAALVLLLFALNTGGNTLPWASAPVLATLIPSIFIFLIFIFIEESVSEPILSLRLLLHRTVCSNSFANWFLAMTGYILIFYIPLYQSTIRGVDDAHAGLSLIPFTLGASCGSLASGLIMKRTGKYYWLCATMLVICTLGCGLCALLDQHTPYWETLLIAVVPAIGFGAVGTILILAVIAAVDHSEQAVATSLSFLFRSSGATIGLAIASSAFQNVCRRSLIQKVTGPDAGEIIRRVRESTDAIHKIPIQYRESVIRSYVDGFKVVFLLSAILSAAALVCALFMKEHVLHKAIERDSPERDNPEE